MDCLINLLLLNFNSKLEKFFCLPFRGGWGGCKFWSDYDELLTKFCAHFYSDRDEFDEEKEPDGMLLSGWTQASSVEKDDNKSIGNGGTTSNASQTVPVAEENDEADNVLSGKKRKVPEVPEGAAQDCVSDNTRKNKKLEMVDDDDDCLMLEGDPGIYKKKKLQ